MSNNDIPKSIEPYISVGVNPEHLQCASCSVYGSHVIVLPEMTRMRCLKLCCDDPDCGRRSWFLCVQCNKRFSRIKYARNHHDKVHTPISSSQNSDEGATNATTNNNDNISNNVKEEIKENDDENSTPFPLLEDNDDGVSSNNRSAGETATIITTDRNLCTSSCSQSQVGCLPNRPVNKSMSWLSQLLRHTDRAAIEDVMGSFDGLERMKLFWVAEHAVKTGTVGGGLIYLVARAFSGSDCIPPDLPSFVEAKWHILNFIQYMSLNENQRRRQAALTSALMKSQEEGSANNNDGFFKTTTNLGYEDLARCYGTASEYSIWNSLPTPKVIAIGDIAYVNPIHTSRFLISNGLDIDKIFVDSSNENPGDSNSPSRKRQKVYHISESAAVATMKRQARNLLSKGSRHGFVVTLWASDWRDGFGPGRTKNNRKSVIIWTLTLSPEKDRVNSTDNTFPIAIGLKSSKHWSAVEHQFRLDTQCLDNPEKPLLCYHGGLKKMIPVYMKRICSIEDKPERAEVTHSLANTGDFHRLYGTLTRICTPYCKSDEVAAFLDKQKNGLDDNQVSWGWSNKYILCSDGRNGGKLPSCKACRKHIITRLLTSSFHHAQSANPGSVTCTRCANWSFNGGTETLLQFSAGRAYPKVADPNCPVFPPKGREAGLEQLSHIDLNFEVMRQAARFAHYHVCGPNRKGRWTRETFSYYLRSCGINKKVEDELWRSALMVREDNSRAQIDYNDPLGIGDFRFPAAWVGPLSAKAYVEAVMHALFLGVAKWNFFFCNIWNTTSRLGEKTFAKNAQNLLLYLKQFGLSWLPTMKFNIEGKKIHGGWVSENFSAWVRISKIVYGWCARRGVESKRLGSDDVIRLVVAFTAVVAHGMARTGVDESYLATLQDLIKEFLNCVSELDIRLRHKEMTTATTATNKNSQQSNQSGSTGNGKGRSAVGTKPKKKSDGGKQQLQQQDINLVRTTTQKKPSEAWWLKSVYIGLLNMVPMIKEFGPLSNWYDGGGKGEKYVQEVKPLVPRGLREGIVQFFVTLLDKVFKLRQIRYLERFLGLQSLQQAESLNEEVDAALQGEYYIDSTGVVRSTDPLADAQLEETEEDSDTCDDDESVSTMTTASDDDPEPVNYSVMEDRQMSKYRTIYIYRNEEVFLHAYQEQEPLAGILVEKGGGMEMYVCFRKPVKSFGWYCLSFDDAHGSQYCGLWYAAVSWKAVEGEPPQSPPEIQELAKMSAVAIPMSFAIGPDKPDSMKYCVITNWWRERHRDGQYRLPLLDDSLWGANVSSDNGSDPPLDDSSEAWSGPRMIGPNLAEV